MVFDWFNRGAGASPNRTRRPRRSRPLPYRHHRRSNHHRAQCCLSEPADTPEDGPAWAREAYARLKAQQQTPDPSPPAEPEPTAVPVESLPEPVPSSSPEHTPAPSGLSLLEKAAAQRQQRQQEQDDRARVAPPEPSIPPQVTSAPAAVDSEEPSLGALDDDFIWSAEVLAAQGRQIDQVSLEEIDWLGRLRRGLEKTRQGFVSGLLENLGDDPLTPEVLDDLETLLLRADAGVQATDQVLDALRQRMNQEVVIQLREFAFSRSSFAACWRLRSKRAACPYWLRNGTDSIPG